jgi:SH3-like domain-containing protein
MIGTVWLREEPRNGSPVTGETVNRGQPVEILAIYDDWMLIRWPIGDPEGASGWVPNRWVGMVAAPPAEIITPGP